jgi:hypothetical protein
MCNTDKITPERKSFLVELQDLFSVLRNDNAHLTTYVTDLLYLINEFDLQSFGCLFSVDAENLFHARRGATPNELLNHYCLELYFRSSRFVLYHHLVINKNLAKCTEKYQGMY